MKGRRQVLTWTFLSMLLFVQTAFFGMQDKTLLQVISESQEQQSTVKEQTLTQKKTKLFLQAVKKGKTASSFWQHQPIWQQTGGKRKLKEDCGYGSWECRRPGKKETGAMRSGLRAPPNSRTSQKGL